MDALELIKTRRSTRRYLQRPVEPEKLSIILEAGRYAPSGGNNQSTHLIVIKNRDILTEIARIVKAECSKMEMVEGMYASMASAIRASKGDQYIFHYDAPVLIVTANKKEYGNNMADCACVLENMMLMANALDLGSCWINQLRWLNSNPILLQYMQNLGMLADERIYGALSVGYPDTENGLPVRQPLERKGNPITIV